MSNGSRYVVAPGSRSAHCCFDYTVVDTEDTTPYALGVCECFDEASARLIAEALNRQERSRKRLSRRREARAGKETGEAPPSPPERF